MSSTHNNAITLSTLPADIIRAIIILENHDVDRLRLISRRWNDLVLEHFAIRKNLPVIHRVSCYGYSTEWVLKMCIDKRSKAYFGLTKYPFYQKDSPIEITMRIKRIKLEKGQANLSAIFKRCSRIEKLELYGSAQDLSLISELLGNVAINQISVDKTTEFNSESRNAVLKLLHSNAVKNFVFYCENHSLNWNILESGVLEQLTSNGFCNLHPHKPDIRLSLAFLPAEITKKIIGMGMQSIDQIGLISPRWNDHVMEFFADPENLPIVNARKHEIERNRASVVSKYIDPFPLHRAS